jgi:hypothetical protein
MSSAEIDGERMAQTPAPLPSGMRKNIPPAVEISFLTVVFKRCAYYTFQMLRESTTSIPSNCPRPIIEFAQMCISAKLAHQVDIAVILLSIGH